MGIDPDISTSVEKEELRGISRSVAEIEWLLLVIVLLYYVFGGVADVYKSVITISLVCYAFFIMGFRYTRFFKDESRWKLAVETWVMTGFITWILWHTGYLESPLINSYLMVIITSALVLGKISTLLELGLIASCFLLLGTRSSAYDLMSLRDIGAMFVKFVPFVVVAYITTMFASDIRYGLNKIKMMSETDELTGILNRRGFAIISDRIFGQSVRYKHPLSLIAIDSDNLKRINDTYGHQAGDQYLIALVKTIQTQLRHTDVMARQGGDEFVALLPETPSAGAFDVAERIRAAVEDTPLLLEGKIINTTVSIGVATYPVDARNLDILLAEADQRMYEAKMGGRNRVVSKFPT